MVHGNHEGFDHLAALLSHTGAVPAAPVTPAELPAVDSRGRVRLLPPGWRVHVGDDLVIGGIGGIQPGQRLGSSYPPLAHLDPVSVQLLRAAERLDVLITHQGPARIQGGSSGSVALDPLLERRGPLVWFHGHSRQQKSPMQVGEARVVPLADATFDKRKGWRIASDAWHEVARTPGGVATTARRPSGVRELPRSAWAALNDGRLVAPHLARWVPDALT